MTRDQLAAKLNGREYTNEITKDEEKAAKDNGLLVYCRGIVIDLKESK